MKPATENPTTTISIATKVRNKLKIMAIQQGVTLYTLTDRYLKDGLKADSGSNDVDDDEGQDVVPGQLVGEPAPRRGRGRPRKQVEPQPALPKKLPPLSSNGTFDADAMYDNGSAYSDDEPYE